jgi:Tol biopolymer transport system component
MDAKKGMLAYMSAEDDDWDIYIIPLGGGKPTNVTDNNSQDGLAAIAPDGKSVAYISNQSGKWALWTVTLSTKEKRRWFDIDPGRGTFDVNNWAGDRMSWTR